MKRRAVALAIAGALALGAVTSVQASGAAPASSVILISLPGISWSDIRGRELPNLRKLLVSTAALSARTASREPDTPRSYMTLGAGNPAFVPRDDPRANVAFEFDDAFEDGTAEQAQARRVGVASGEIVQLETPALQGFQDRRFYGTEIGRLGQALSEHGRRAAVVSAADNAVRPTDEQRRRPAVLAMMNARGGVHYGKLDDLLRSNPRAPFGVETSPSAFVAAAKEAIGAATVTLLDIGETSRADEYIQFVATDRIDDIRRGALRRTDTIVGRLLPLLRSSMVLTFSPAGPTRPPFREHLGVIGAAGKRPGGQTFDRSWLTSATTGRQGMVVLSDIAPTVLDVVGIDKPNSMIGTPIRQGERRDRHSTWLSDLIELDLASSVRETFATGAFWVIAILLSLLAILAFVVFLGPRGRWLRLLVAVAYFGLAIFPAAHIIRAFEFWWLGSIGAHVALYAVAAALALAAWFLPGPRWAGGVALLILAALLYGSDVAIGGPLQLNGVFGHSPLVAGRFYGVSNPGYTILFAATLLGLTELAELRGHRSLPLWGMVGCVVLLPLIGLPSMGADFGGLLAGVPAVGVTIALGRGWRIRWRTAVLFAAGGAAIALGLSFVDWMRPAETRTHLGRFADLLVTGNLGELGTLIERKGAAAINSLTVTRWTYFIPVGLAVLTLLLLRPRGVLRDVLPGRPLLRAGLWGTLVAGGLGFAVNDSGISIPALALAFTIPFLVLVAVDTVEPRKPKPP